MSRRPIWPACLLLLLAACAPVGAPADGPAPLPPTPAPASAPASAARCQADLGKAVAGALALLDDPRAVEPVTTCMEQLAPLVAAARRGEVPAPVRGVHPFWSGAAYRLSVEPLLPGLGSTPNQAAGSGALLAVRDHTGLAPLDLRAPVQEIVVQVDAAAAAEEGTLRLAVAHACAHVGQQLLQAGHLAGAVPPECLGGAIQLAAQRARRNGAAEPLAYAVQMAHARRAGLGRGPMYAFFTDLFPVGTAVEALAGAPGYGRWREAVRAYAAGDPPLHLALLTAAGDPAGRLGEACAGRLATGYAETLGEGGNPFAAYGTPAWGAWAAYVEGAGCGG